MTTNTRHTRRLVTVLSLAFFALAALPAHAMKIRSQNLAQLITDAQSIVFGSVSSVTDGIDAKGVPYTEITLQIGSVAKGNIKDGESYTFRQFGLLQPRKLANGKTYLAVSPEGFPRWIEGETVMAFLRQPASLTGLQTTAGMGQGKLSLVNGRLINEYNNSGMFEGMTIDSSRLNSEQQNMLVDPSALDVGAFVDLVGRAVSEQWIEKGVIK